MSKDSLAKFKNLLRRKELELNKRLNRQALAACASPEEGERRQFQLDSEIAAVAYARESQLLEVIEAALDRVASGHYGTCENCLRGIPRQRLEAVPWALFCRDCQEQLESSGCSRP
jgi:RNA polymerase-binding transcription factor DksA